MSIALDGIAPQLQVHDMARSIAFYCDVLGFQVMATSPRHATEVDWCMLAQGEIAIMLAASSEPAARTAAESILPDDRGIALYFGCTDVDAAHAQLQRLSYPVAAPVTTPYGMRQLRLRDPDGFELCLQHPVDDRA
jgi:glyoxylase I family protein